MATVRMMLKKSDRPSEEQIRALQEGSKKRKRVFDADSPEMTPEMLAHFKRVNPQKSTAAN